MPAMAADDDQIDRVLLGKADDLALGIAHDHMPTALVEVSLICQLPQLLFSVFMEFAFNAHGRQQRFTGRIDGQRLDHMDEAEPALVALTEIMGSFEHLRAFWA